MLHRMAIKTYPIQKMKPYKKFGLGNFKISQNLAANSISLPSSSDLSINEQNYIVKTFLEELDQIKND